jgi:radical SAM protein with 4Fe4S-binding SPASM domain
MSYSKFETDGGIVFYYDNQTNNILEADGTPLFVSTRDEQYEEFAAANYSTRKKNRAPTAIRLLMGHACNFSCTYCMQKDIGNPDELPKNKGLQSLFDSVSSNLDLSNLQRLELWGGEPFLYWNDMVEIMSFFDSKKMTFGITTNGSALSLKHAEFFSQLNAHVIVTISHDAEKQQALRGEDPLSRSRVIQTLKQFDRVDNVTYGFLCSITNTNFDLFEINDFFRGKIIEHGLNTNSLSFSLGRTYNENEGYNPSSALGCNIIEDIPQESSFTHVISGDNLEKFRTILSEFLEQHYVQLTNSIVDGQPTIFGKSASETPLLLCDIYESILPYSVVEYARKIIGGEQILESSNCGADMADVLSIDIDGSIRTCPHAGKDHIMGNITSIASSRIIPITLGRKTTHCTDCVVNKLCRSSCPINLPTETFLTNCRVEKIWYGEIQKAALRLIMDDCVKMVSTGIQNINS